MGAGLAAAIAAAVSQRYDIVVGFEGDSAFGFSGMEMETICRYHLPVVIIVFVNNGVYGGIRTPQAASRYPGGIRFTDKVKLESAQTTFVPQSNLFKNCSHHTFHLFLWRTFFF